jgi:hypothetical protein
MKCFFRKIGRFFWSWGFLKFVLLAITLAIFLRVEEDWRGARAWATIKAKWEAQGETFDITRLAPRPVPDAQNLAALPLFKMELDPDGEGAYRGVLAPLALNRALQWDWEKIDFPRGGNWQNGQLADHAKNRTIVEVEYARNFKTASSTQDVLAQFEALCPALDELRSAVADRPYCRFEQNYQFEMPYDLYLNLITGQIKVAKFLTADAVLALDTKRPDVAMEDIRTNLKLISGLRQQPLLVSGLVAVGMSALDFSAIYEGLTIHAWNDAQLADLEGQLAQGDFLAHYQLAIRGEACLTISNYDRLKPNRRRLVSELHSRSETVPPSPSEQHDFLPFVWPNGWIDQVKVRAANFDLTAVRFVDIGQRVVLPKAADQFVAEIERNQQRNGNPFSIWAILSGAATGPINNALQKFSGMQVWVDETRIACALERYRLAHEAYPQTLEELVPACIDALPHDIMNGEAYHYRLNADGTFLLYSVGWNQADDGGKVVMKTDSPTSRDDSQGDWVWPTPKL